MRFVWRLLLSLIFFANSLCLLIAITAPYISPEVLWFPAFFGLFFKVFFFVNLVFAIYFLLSLKLFKLIFGIVFLALSYPSLKNTFAFGHSTPETKNSITLLTYNVENLGWYEIGRA